MCYVRQDGGEGGGGAVEEEEEEEKVVVKGTRPKPKNYMWGLNKAGYTAIQSRT